MKHAVQLTVVTALAYYRTQFSFLLVLPLMWIETPASFTHCGLKSCCNFRNGGCHSEEHLWPNLAQKPKEIPFIKVATHLLLSLKKLCT